MEAALRDYLAAGQTGGRIRTDLDNDWLRAMLGAVITKAARPHLGPGSCRTDTVRVTVLSLLAPPSDPASRR